MVFIWLGTFMLVVYVAGQMGFLLYIAITLGLVAASMMLLMFLMTWQHKDADLRREALFADDDEPVQ
jgi:hypothetical protein